MKLKASLVLLILLIAFTGSVFPVPLKPHISGPNPDCFEWGSIGGDLPQRGCRYNATGFGLVYYGDDEGLNFLRFVVPGPLGLFVDPHYSKGLNLPTLVMEWNGNLGHGFYLKDNALLGQFVWSCNYFGWSTEYGWFGQKPFPDGPCIEGRDL